MSLAERLRHVYWIGGGPGAGKSTIARRLAGEHGLRLYVTDDVMPEHARRCTDCPALTEFIAMDMDQRWLNRSPEIMLETFHWFRGEGFELIVDDLLRLPREPRVIVEGFRLLPSLVKPLLASPDQAVWLLPDPDFRLAAFTSRGSLWRIPHLTSDPERTLVNLLERDRLFTGRLAAETQRLGLNYLKLDVTVNHNDLARTVTALFGLTPGRR
jgi:hypothetical protein